MLALLGLLVVVGGLIAVLAPQVTSQARSWSTAHRPGLSSLQNWVAGPPFNLGPDALGGLLDKGVKELQSNSQQVAGVVHRQPRRDRVGGGHARAGAGAVLLLPQGRPAVPAVAAHLDRPRHRARTSRWCPTGCGPRWVSTSGRRPRWRSWTGCSSVLGVWILGVPVRAADRGADVLRRLRADRRGVRGRRDRHAGRAGLQRRLDGGRRCWRSCWSSSNSRAT